MVITQPQVIRGTQPLMFQAVAYVAGQAPTVAVGTTPHEAVIAARSAARLREHVRRFGRP